MKMLLHMCCAPCTTYSERRFRELGYKTQGFFFNPNIHPFKEFQRRLHTLKEYCEKEKIPLTIREGYDLEGFLRSILDNIAERCRVCYQVRLEETAREASRLEIPCFSSTLAISPYQDHKLLRCAGEEAGRKYGVNYVYEDLRPGYRESVEMSKNLGLYRQPYCGCVFSEKERYQK